MARAHRRWEGSCGGSEEEGGGCGGCEGGGRGRGGGYIGGVQSGREPVGQIRLCREPMFGPQQMVFFNYIKCISLSKYSKPLLIKKLSNTKLYKILRYTTFILRVSPFKVVYKI
jgi:hypothetical protein